MKIFLKVKPRAKIDKIEKISENVFHVSIKEPPEQGRANEAVISTLAEYFDISRSSIKIISGATSRQKIIEILKKI